jgi:hypothetical protein
LHDRTAFVTAEPIVSRDGFFVERPAAVGAVVAAVGVFRLALIPGRSHGTHGVQGFVYQRFSFGVGAGPRMALQAETRAQPGTSRSFELER